jgi:molybdopterin molybdotransferase
VASRLDLPPFDKSAVDGYAIVDGDVGPELTLLGLVAAGQPCRYELQPGQAVKVMTGAPVPAGTGRVVMLEHAVEDGERVRIEPGHTSRNVCSRAEDVKVGDVVVRAGRRLGAVEIASLISCGVTRVAAAAPPKLAIVSTGDEIVDDPAQLAEGRIMNSNGPLLAMLAHQYKLEVVYETRAADSLEDTRRALSEALAAAPLVVLSGGVSAGDFDFVPAVMEELELTPHFTRLASKPGKPLTLATGAGGVVLGLPGNPVAVYLMFHLFVLRAARRLMGLPTEPRTLSLRLARSFERRKGARTEHVPCRIDADGRVRSLEYHGSAHLAALLNADGFFVVPRGELSLPADAEVRVLLPDVGWEND